MEKSKHYQRTKCSADVLRESVDTLLRLAYPNGKAVVDGGTLQVTVDGARWAHDNEEEFFADYRRSSGYVYFSPRLRDSESERYSNSSIMVSISPPDTRVDVNAVERKIVEAVFEVFERHAENSQLPALTTQTTKRVIFVGHGHSQVWRDLKDHLHEQHSYPIEAYETGARAGHAIRDILDEMASVSAFALLVLTPDDKIEGDIFRARQNVVHETGLFQGRLGFSRAIVLLEDGVEEFSNVSGIQQIRFSKGNIRETYGDVLATIKREFGDV